MVQTQHAFFQGLYARPSSIELKDSMKEPRYERERCTTMNGNRLHVTVRPLEEPTENVVARASWPRRLLERRNARQLELKRQQMRQENDQRLAWHVEDIIAARGLTQPYYSVVGGRGLRVPHVVAVASGPPVRLDVRILPGQTLGDFVAQAPAIADNLGMADVRVVPLGPSLIRLELLPGPG
jgi:hypothetical protein